jgi:hypothetical protein
MMTEFEGLARSSGILHDEKENEPDFCGDGKSGSFPKYRSLTNKFPKSTTAKHSLNNWKEIPQLRLENRERRSISSMSLGAHHRTGQI